MRLNFGRIVVADVVSIYHYAGPSPTHTSLIFSYAYSDLTGHRRLASNSSTASSTWRDDTVRYTTYSDKAALYGSMYL